MIRVWLIEDDALFRETVVDVLDAHDDVACTGQFVTCEEALAALGAAEPAARPAARPAVRHPDGPAPDVILLDLGLPGMGGIEGTSHLRAAAPQAEIVVLTVHGDSDRIFSAITRGASGYVLKPSSARDIVRAVRAAHRGESPITPRIARRILDMFPQPARAGARATNTYGLSRRERDVLELMVSGMTKRDMAQRLSLSPHTIDQHVRRIYSKLDVHTRGHAVAKAVGERLVSPP